MGFTVLGLLGPAGSGKDLVADWFQENNFVKVAFADPMKRFAKEAFNLSTKQLWGPSEERNREFVVDDAWWFEVIGHFGKASEEIVNQVLNQGNRVTGYLKLHDWFTQLRKDYQEKISARIILQTLGTEWGRAVDPAMWTNYAYETIRAIESGQKTYTQVAGLRTRHPTMDNRTWVGAIIPDHRFENEVKGTQEQGGYVMRLRRLAHEKKESVGVAGHRSEAEQKTLPDELFDLVVEFDEGVEKVYATLDVIHTEELWKKRKTDPSLSSLTCPPAQTTST